MIFLHISTEFAADESEPAEEFAEWVPLHPSFAVSAEEAHAKLTPSTRYRGLLRGAYCG